MVFERSAQILAAGLGLFQKLAFRHPRVVGLAGLMQTADYVGLNMSKAKSLPMKLNPVICGGLNKCRKIDISDRARRIIRRLLGFHSQTATIHDDRSVVYLDDIHA